MYFPKSRYLPTHSGGFVAETLPPGQPSIPVAHCPSLLTPSVHNDLRVETTTAL